MRLPSASVSTLRESQLDALLRVWVHSPVQGALLMLAFGAGTLPNLLALGWSAHALRGLLAHRALRVGAGLLVIAFGIAGLARLDPSRHLHSVVDACIRLF